MNNWDHIRKYGKKVQEKAINFKDNYGENKKKLEIFFDKYKIFRRMFIIGILVNGYFVYNSMHTYLHLKIINDRISKNREEFEERLTARKFQILDAAMNEGK